MMKKIDLLEAAKRKFLGEGLGSCSIEELERIEQQLERSLSNVRARKLQVFKEQIEQLKEKEKVLLDENTRLTENAKLSEKQSIKDQNEHQPQYYAESSPSSDVETELFIGLPEQRTRRLSYQEASQDSTTKESSTPVYTIWFQLHLKPENEYGGRERYEDEGMSIGVRPNEEVSMKTIQNELNDPTCLIANKNFDRYEYSKLVMRDKIEREENGKYKAKKSIEWRQRVSRVTEKFEKPRRKSTLKFSCVRRTA
ncbi:unnamed protein product [Sphenostylis stenocarpa]|uniref:K-box domain-containing protein n=1 Tax=Sphenostylis stenocarpa TaxID=92480 RepID=A0AA86SAV4_9FABA|nr:unnamed protein product [Sphenostylis stenocarpa]